MIAEDLCCKFFHSHFLWKCPKCKQKYQKSSTPSAEKDRMEVSGFFLPPCNKICIYVQTLLGATHISWSSFTYGF